MVGAASAAGALALATVPAAGAATSSVDFSKTLVKCTGTLTTQVPPGTQPGFIPTQGKQTGKVRCKKGLGTGRQLDKFKTSLTTGNLVGTFVVRFKKGTIKGKFKLIPTEGTLGGGGLYSPSTFGASGFAGTLKFKSGTGVFAGIKGKGTAILSSTDGIHFKVKEKL